MEKRFSHEGRQYVLAFRKNQFVVYEKQSHNDRFFLWWDQEPQKRVKNPIRLVRQIWEVTREFLYQARTPYFEIFVSDPKRSRIYRKFLNTLSGYQYFEYGYSYAVVKIKGDHEQSS